MKKQQHFTILLFLNIFLLLTNQALAQDCLQSTAQIDLDVNNVKARLQVGGDLWWDESGGEYIVPQPAPGDPEVGVFSAGGLWLGGFDPGGGLKMAAQTYGRSNGNSDYWPGPLTETGETTPNDCANFDRFWKTTSADINAHKADWADNGVIDDPISPSILAWPGKGNPNFESIHGFVLPSTEQGLAPFHDENFDGVYEPQAGDYPNINGADQGIWWVFNDAGNVHSESGGASLQFEIQVLAYAYSSSNDNINNATYYDYKFINRALEQIDSAYAGLWIAPKLGCGIDDYLGCDTTNNLAFIYNADSLDGYENCYDCIGFLSYCEEIPLVGIKILKGVTDIENGLEVDRGMSSFIYYNNAGIEPAPLPATSDPSWASEHFRYLSGSWRDGSRITSGGDGYDPLSTQFTNYVYPDSPNDPDGWSMCTEESGLGHRRIVIGSGPFRLDPGAVNSLSFAVLFVEDVPHPCPDITPLQLAAEDAQDLFDTAHGGITSIEEVAKTLANIEFQPNPMNQQSTMIFNELANSVEQVSVYSIDGKLMRVYDSVEGESLTIEKGELGSGMYFYKILTDDFKVYSGKFVVR